MGDKRVEHAFQVWIANNPENKHYGKDSEQFKKFVAETYGEVEYTPPTRPTLPDLLSQLVVKWVVGMLGVYLVYFSAQGVCRLLLESSQLLFTMGAIGVGVWTLLCLYIFNYEIWPMLSEIIIDIPIKRACFISLLIPVSGLILIGIFGVVTVLGYLKDEWTKLNSAKGG